MQINPLIKHSPSLFKHAFFVKPLSVIVATLFLLIVNTVHASLPSSIDVTINAIEPEISHASAIQAEFTYTNNSSSPVTFLIRDTALEGKIMADILAVQRQGTVLPYIGPIYQRLPPSASEYLTLAVGQSQSMTVRLDQVYNFDQIGSYDIQYKRATQSKSTLSSATITILQARPAFKQPPAFTNTCNATQQSRTDSALSIAESTSARARNDLRATPTNLRSQADRYREWFGAYTQQRWNTVQTNFDRIYSTASGRTLTFDCACRQGGPNVVAYVYASRAYEIFLCPIFWNIPTSGGSISKAGVIVHEISHFNVVADTNDHAYGITNSRNLASNNPNLAVRSADNYAYFAENPTGRSMPRASSGGGGNTTPTPTPEPEPEPLPSYLPAITDIILEDQ